VGFILAPLCGWFWVDFLGNAAVWLFALAVENTSLLFSRYFVLDVEILPDDVEILRSCYFAPAVERLRWLVSEYLLLPSKYFALAIEVLRSCCRNTSRLVAPLNYRVGDDRPEMA
jgi:hypothetical protein